MGTLENLKKLPEKCFATLRATGEVIAITRGEIGYAPIRNLVAMDIDKVNAGMGCNKAQKEAMIVGSMFGWHVPGADADMYDPETGKPKK